MQVFAAFGVAGGREPYFRVPHKATLHEAVYFMSRDKALHHRVDVEVVRLAPRRPHTQRFDRPTEDKSRYCDRWSEARITSVARRCVAAMVNASRTMPGYSLSPGRF
jgi:hypothetical protein